MNENTINKRKKTYIGTGVIRCQNIYIAIALLRRATKMGHDARASRVECPAQFILHGCGIVLIAQVFESHYLLSYPGHIMPYLVLMSL